ncbi:unnamed protein product, partial [Mesorhabditis spiculigera]
MSDSGRASNPSTSQGYLENGETVNQALDKLLRPLLLYKLRKLPDKDYGDSVRDLHEQISTIIGQEPDGNRRRRLRRASPAINYIREQVFLLMRTRQDMPDVDIPRLVQSLDAVVKESFDEHFREAATALATLVILIKLPMLTQVYAGLIRNVSWMADSKMFELLSPTCPAVAEAFVDAYKKAIVQNMSNKEARDREMAAVSATLSALWNLASHSTDNKKAICKTEFCLTYLVELLTPNAKATLIVESATGVLKYATQYVSSAPCHAQIRASLLPPLLPMLNSSSFTIISNTVSAIDNLIVHDPNLQNYLREQAYSQLNTLRNSQRDDIRALVKRVLNHLNNAAMYTSQQYNSMMSASMGGDMLHSASPRYMDNRLLTLRASRASPGAPALPQQTMSIYNRSSSLPRHFSNRITPLNGNPAMVNSQFQKSPDHISQRSYLQSNETSQESGVVGDDGSQLDGELHEIEPTESLRVSPSTSTQSLGSLMPEVNTSGWESVVDTADNSARLSPVSPSDLPDSPTAYSNPNFMMQQVGFMSLDHAANGPRLNPQPMAALQISTTTPRRPNLHSRQTTASSDATSIPSDEPTPTYPLRPSRRESHSDDDVLPGPIDENDYASLPIDHTLLDKSIAAALPPKKPDVDRKGALLLSEAIESAMPPPRFPSGPGLLDAAIRSQMPSSSPFSTQQHHLTTTPKNAVADGHQQLAASHRPSAHQQAAPVSLINKSLMCNHMGELVRDAARLDESFEHPDSEDEPTDYSESSSEAEPITEVNADLPSDVLEELEKEKELLERAREKASNTQNRTSRLRPPIARKPTNVQKPTSPRMAVQPYNYKKSTGAPVGERDEEKQPDEQQARMRSSSNKLLVTTV